MLFHILIAVYMHNNYQKAPACPHTTRAGGSRPGRAPGKGDGERGGGGRAEEGIGYCWSIAIAAYPVTGKKLIEKWLASKNKDIFMDHEGKS
ncbi:MAG: hypothetical protein C5S44_12040 [Candidatus Methanocomedens sp.]|nr:MAG: hypothetical protein C5S44_12040 [ANME-2 cluster archaeon]